MLTYHDVLPEYLRLKTDAERASPLPKWSGAGEPPAIGATVHVKINGIGTATVLRYFVEHGYLGLFVEAESPPAWMVEQNGHKRCHVFGAEVGS